MLFRDGDVWSIWNSFVLASASTVIAMVLGIMCAYSIVRFRTGGENLAIWIISQRLLPPIAIVFPIFLIYSDLGLTDTYQGLILLYTVFALPYVIWLMRGYIQEVPLALEESALVDGASRWQVLWLRGGAGDPQRHLRHCGLRLHLLVERVPLRPGANPHRGHHLSGPGEPVLRRAVDVLGEDLRHVRARHAADLLRRRRVPALPGARHFTLGAVKG